LINKPFAFSVFMFHRSFTIVSQNKHDLV